MKKKILLVILSLTMIGVMVGCDKNVPEEIIPTTLEVYQKFVDAGLPVGDYVDYTEETDPNGLMNKSGQYVAKMNFAIEGIFQFDASDPQGGSIEIFKNTKDAQARKEYIDKIGGASPMFAESSEIVYGIILIRLNRDVTNTQTYFDAVKP